MSTVSQEAGAAGKVPVLSFRPGGGVEVDLGTLLETRLLVQGSSRSGKTHSLYYLLQQTYGEVLLARHPDPLTREELAAAAVYRVGGYFNTAVKALETMGAIEKHGKRLVASRLLYPAGLS